MKPLTQPPTNPFGSGLCKATCAIGMALALLLPGSVLAHGDEDHGASKGEHGGTLRAAGGYHFELILNRGEAHVWATGHDDAPRRSQGAHASLRLLSKGGAFNVELTPSTGNELVGKDPRIQSLPGLRGILNVTMQDGKPLQARYVMNAEKDAHTHH